MKKQNIIGLHDAEKDHFKGKDFPNYALNGSDARVAVKAEEEKMLFMHLSKLLPEDAVYFINVDVKPEDDYEEKILHVDQGGI